MRVTAGILLNRDQRRYSAAFAIDAPHQVSRTLGSDHHHVYIGGRNDGFEMNAEAVGDAENFPGMQIGLDELIVDLSLGLVRGEYVDPVGALGSFIRSHDDHAVGPRLLRARPIGIESDDDFVSAIAEILRLRMSLAAVAQDGDRLALQCFGLGVAFIENSDHQRAPLIAQGRKEALACWGWISVGPPVAAKGILYCNTDRSVGII